MEGQASEAESVFRPAVDVNELQQQPEESLSRATVERLEAAELLRLDQKVDILLVAAGEKPATELSFGSRAWREGETPAAEVIRQDQLNEFAERVREARLLIDVRRRTVNVADEARQRGEDIANIDPREYELLASVVVARTPEALATMRRAEVEQDRVAYGLSCGYPETAVRAHQAGQGVWLEDIAGESADVSMRAFGRFAFSAEHWQEELATVRRWAKVVKVASPKLYAEMLAREQGR